MAKVLIKEIGATRFDVEVSPRKKPQPLNIEAGQVVGISFKHGYGKFIFDTTVIGFGPSSNTDGSGMIVLSLPGYIEMAPRRSYFRINVPPELQVKVAMWHRQKTRMQNQSSEKRQCWHGRLVDISAGGMQVAIDAVNRPDFRAGQFIRMRFTPLPDETPLYFCAQIRIIQATADNQHFCLGLQAVGLEASPEGRLILQRLCNVVEQYYKMNQSTVKQQDFQTTNLRG